MAKERLKVIILIFFSLATVSYGQWVKLNFETALPVVSITSKSSDSLWVAVGRENQAGYFYSSINGGQSWNEIKISRQAGMMPQDSTDTFDLPVSLSINEKGGVLFCTIGCAYFSTDFGNKWKYYSVYTYGDGNYYNITKGVISKDNSLFMAGRTYAYQNSSWIRRSIDNGLTWTTLNTPFATSFGDMVISGNSLFEMSCYQSRIMYPQDYTVYRSNDNGNTWFIVFNITNNFNTLYPEHLMALGSSPDETLLLSSDQAVYKSTNDGNNWLKIDSLTEHRGFTNFCFIKPGIVFARNTNGIFKSTDNGNSWSPISTNFAASTLAVDSEYNMYAGTQDGKVYKWTEYYIAKPRPPVPPPILPDNYSLAQNYPNPFNPTTTIKYELPKTEYVQIKVFDLLGREVAILVNDEISAGSYSVKFDASNLTSGVYFYHIMAGSYNEIRKMVLIK